MISAAASPALAHGGSLAEEAWHACAEAARGAACAFENADGDVHLGSCRGQEAPYLCVRSQPLVRHGDAAETPAAVTPAPLPSAGPTRYLAAYVLVLLGALVGAGLLPRVPQAPQRDG